MAPLRHAPRVADPAAPAAPAGVHLEQVATSAAPHHGFSERTLDYLHAHAIDPALAAEAGVTERDGEVVYPYCGGRRRPLDGDRTFQPAGVPLALWWLRGHPNGSTAALVTEGEPDALSALSALIGGQAPTGASSMPVCAIPGCGFPAGKLADELRGRGVEQAYLALDADDAGRQYVERAVPALRAVGVAPFVIRPADGHDLSDEMAAAERPGERLFSMLLDAETEAQASRTEAKPEPEAAVVRFMSPEELRASVPSEPPWRWHGYLAAGALTVLGGQPKAGKSTLALALSAAVDGSAPAFLGHAIDGGPVVYVSEEGAATLAHKVGGRLRIATRDTAWPKPDWPTVVAAAVAEAQLVQAALLVVDTFAFWAALGAESEKDAGAMQAAMGPLLVATRAGLAVLLVVHARKGGGEDGEALRGSSALAGSADIILELERIKGGPARQRKLLALSRYTQTPGALVIDHDAAHGSWGVIGEGTDRGDARDIADRGALLAAIGDGEPTRAELEQAMGSPEKQWHGTLKELISTGTVGRSGAGVRGDPHRFRILRTNAAQNVRRNDPAAGLDAAAPRRGQHQVQAAAPTFDPARCAESEELADPLARDDLAAWVEARYREQR